MRLQPQLICRTWRRGSAKRAQTLAEALEQVEAGCEALTLTGEADTPFVRELAEVLARNETVRWLQLDRNHLCDEAADALAVCLVDNSCLVSLDLDFNDIGDKGISRMAEALEINSGLQELQLHCNRICSTGAVRLGKALKKNSALRSLSLHGNPIKDFGARGLAAALASNTVLRSLSLHGACITDAGVEHLAMSLEHNSALRELNLGRNSLADKGAAHLARMLEVNTHLQELRLDGNKIGDVGGSQLAQALELNQGLIELWLIDNPIGTIGVQYFAQALRKNKRINRLGLTAAVTDEADIARGLDDLRKHHKVKRAVKAVESGNSHLAVADEDLGDEGAECLAEAIEGSGTLLGLSLEKCQIGDKGAVRLAEALEKNGSLLEVSLAGNSIGDQGASRLIEVLERNDTIYELDLADNPVGQDVIATMEDHPGSRTNFGPRSEQMPELPPNAAPDTMGAQPLAGLQGDVDDDIGDGLEGVDDLEAMAPCSAPMLLLPRRTSLGNTALGAERGPPPLSTSNIRPGSGSPATFDPPPRGSGSARPLHAGELAGDADGPPQDAVDSPPRPLHAGELGGDADEPLQDETDLATPPAAARARGLDVAAGSSLGEPSAKAVASVGQPSRQAGGPRGLAGPRGLPPLPIGALQSKEPGVAPDGSGLSPMEDDDGIPAPPGPAEFAMQPFPDVAFDGPMDEFGSLDAEQPICLNSSAPKHRVTQNI